MNENRKLCRVSLKVTTENFTWNIDKYTIIKETGLSYRAERPATAQVGTRGTPTGPINIQKSAIGVLKTLGGNRDNHSMVARHIWCFEDDIPTSKAELVNDIGRVVRNIRNNSEQLLNQSNKAAFLDPMDEPFINEL